MYATTRLAFRWWCLESPTQLDNASVIIYDLLTAVRTSESHQLLQLGDCTAELSISRGVTPHLGAGDDVTLTSRAMSQHHQYSVAIRDNWNRRCVRYRLDTMQYTTYERLCVTYWRPDAVALLHCWITLQATLSTTSYLDADTQSGLQLTFTDIPEMWHGTANCCCMDSRPSDSTCLATATSVLDGPTSFGLRQRCIDLQQFRPLHSTIPLYTVFQKTCDHIFDDKLK